MQWKMLIRLMPNRMLMILLGIAVCLFLCCFLALGQVGLSISEANRTRVQEAEMTAFVSEWHTHQQIVENAKARPTALVDADKMQSDILLLLTANRLQLTSFKALQEDVKKADGLSFELTCRGSWEAVASMIENFSVPGKLIGIQNVKLTPEKELVEAKVTYKIYIK